MAGIEYAQQLPPHDHADSPLYIMLRREINEHFAAAPVDFNRAGLHAGQLVLGRSYRSSDVIGDIGSNSGRMIIEAAFAENVPAQLVCLEPDTEAVEAHQLLPIRYRQRVSFVQTSGEALALADDSLEGITLHNVIYRVHDAIAVLREASRTVKPGGFIAISSNDEGHAPKRHGFEAFTAFELMRQLGISFTAPQPPATGRYMKDLPQLIAQIPSLQSRDDLYVAQSTEAVITTGDRLETYLYSIMYSAANTDLPPQYRSQWRSIVNNIVRASILEDLQLPQSEHVNRITDGQPYFSDSIKRGMFVLQNNK